MMRDGGTVVARALVAVILANVLAMQSSRVEAGQVEQPAFSGKVVDAAGGPIEGVRIRLFQQDFAAASFEPKTDLVGETTTGSDGAYAVGFPPQDEGNRYGYLLAEKAGLAIAFASGVMRKSQTFDLTMGAPASLAGVVVDENGGPVADASIGVYALQMPQGSQRYNRNLPTSLASKLLTTRTDAAGRFAFAALPADATAEFVVKKPGRATVCTFNVATYAGRSLTYAVGRTDVRLVQPPEARIEGVVVRKDGGGPVAGIKLVVIGARNRPLDGYEPIESKPDGAFTAPDLPAGQFTLELAPPAEQPAEWVATPVPVAVETGQTRKDVKIEVGKGGVLEVAVSDAANSQPAPKANISVRDTANDRWLSATADANGVARLRLNPGSYEFREAWKRGYTYDGQPEPLQIEENAIRRLMAALKAMPKIRGVVRDPNGAAVAGARVRIQPAALDEILSDAQGRFEITWDRNAWGRENTTFCLVVRHPDRNLAAATELAEGTTTLDVALEPGAVITGRVTDPNGKGIAGAQVRPMLFVSNWGSSIAPDPITTQSDGTFRVQAAPAGRRYFIEIAAGGYGRKRVPAEADDTTRRRLDVGRIALPVANLSISGVVVDPEDKPIADASVETYGEEQPERQQTRTDAEGRFALAGVCAGQITLQVQTGRSPKHLTANILTEGGAADLRIMLQEGRSPVRRMGGKSYEQILATAAKAIAGVAIDEKGSPVAGVSVQVCCHKTLRDGRSSWTYSDFRELSATTDTQGRFAIELTEDGEYNLRLSPDKFAAIIVYDVPVGQRDLRVTLARGGTIAGRLLRVEKGRKVPIPHAEVKIEQTDRSAFSHLGFDRDRTATTDDEGRFHFEYLSTLQREDRVKPLFIPRTWQISFGRTSQTIAFDKGDTIDDFEMVIRPDPATAPPLTGGPLPGFEGVKIDLPPEQTRDKRVLVCFFDWEQRPSRGCVTQLAQLADSLAAKSVMIAAVSVSAGTDALQAWAKENRIPFPTGTIDGDRDEVLATWSVKSLPWLILSDSGHSVTAEGFSLAELDRKLDGEPAAKP
jgi:uncharacterized GH25 family protein